MKDITCYLRFLTLALCFSFAACSDEDEKTAPPVFPELQKIECAVGQTAVIEFEANSNWKLTSSALWCKFLMNDEAVNACSGSAGKQKVTIQISDDATEMEKVYKAEIALWMNGSKGVIYEVTRPTTGHEVVLLDAQNRPFSEENPCIVPYEGNLSIKVKANFDWKLDSCPEWMNCNMTADVAFENQYPLTPVINSNFLKDPATGFFTFVNVAGTEVAKIPVKYDGIPEGKIKFSLKQSWGWAFSADGLTYTGGGTVDTGDGGKETPLTFSVIAKNDAYKIVLLESKNWIYSHLCAPEWYQVADDKKGTIGISCDENSGAVRKGCVMIFPQSIYDAIGDAKFDEIVLPNGEIDPDYEKYMAIDFEQKEKSGGFKVKDENSGTSLPVISLAEEGYTEFYLKELYGTSNVYRLELSAPYEYLEAEASGYIGSTTYCMVSTGFSDGSSGWEDASAQSAWIGGRFNIFGIPAMASGQMIITISDPMTEEIFGVLIVQQFGAARSAKMKIRK